MTTQHCSTLKEARLLTKLRKKLGLKPGASMDRIVQELGVLLARARATNGEQPPAGLGPAPGLNADGTLDVAALLQVVDSVHLVARGVSKWHKPESVALTAPMQALQKANSGWPSTVSTP